MKAAIYARVSTTNGQTPKNQLLRLREVAAKAGWTVAEEFVDRGISGVSTSTGKGSIRPRRAARPCSR